ncbi:hypothetical protein C5167_002936 [Papaver somniferum]|uniref:Uncharacterized protein n=1 Tax=Papaver somniferum TaxID=3469 RepID=A0A4Y7L2T3_PAPSO|nr:hypothetical protein C5167_002936 [Papaver somniferum]
MILHYLNTNPFIKEKDQNKTMVFTSVPLYLDPPNWHQQTHHHQPAEGTNNGNNPQLLPPQPPAPSNACTGSGGSGGASTIKPG